MPDRTFNGRRIVDRAGAATAAGISVARIDQLYRDRTSTGFPDRIAGTTSWYEEDIAAWKQAHDQAKLDQLTDVDRTGDPSELVATPGVARILGYRDRRSLNNSSVWPGLLDQVDDEETLPSGRIRRRWRRSTVWAVADARTGKHGTGRPPNQATGDVNRTGDPDELVGANEAARILGYAPTSSLPTALIELADDIHTGSGGRQRRRWRRRTLWAYADTRSTT